MPLQTDAEIDAYCDNLAKAGTEHAHQRAFFGWLNAMQYLGRHPMARLAFAVPNGGKRDAITAARLKAEGVKKGVHDVCYPVALGGFHSLWLELKKPKVGKASEEQNEWAIDMTVCGHACATCWGWRAARAAFLDYTNGATLQKEYV